MKNCIEQDMLQLEEEQRAGQKSGVGKVKVQYEIAKRKRFLSGLNMVVAGPDGNSCTSQNNSLLDEYIIMENTARSFP